MSTTIQIEEQTRDKIKSFGMKGETYNDIINRLYDSAVREQLRDFLYDSKDSISIDEALADAKRRWPK